MVKASKIFKHANNNSVLRITASSISFDWARPYNKHNDVEGTGTGFVVDKVCDLNQDEESFFLLTAYHVVESAKQILVRIESTEGGSRVVYSDLVACNPDLDVAVVKVPVKLPGDIQPLKCGDSDEIQPLDEIQALGYALGKEHLNYTTGVISARTPSAIQIDAAINPGNSGGPVMHSHTGDVIGVVISSYKTAQNMSFACPVKEAIDSMERLIRQGKKYELFPHIGAKIVTTSSVLVESLGIPNGCMCTHVHPDSNIYRSGVRSGDIITHIQNYPVQYDGTIRPLFWKDPLSYKSIIYRGAIGDVLDLKYFNVKTNTHQQTKTNLERNKNVFREMWPEFEDIRYCTSGGVVVQPLVANLSNPEVSKHLHWKFHSMMDSPIMKNTSVLIITHLQADCPFKKTPGTLAIGDVITGINDISLHDDTGAGDPFQRYVSAWNNLGTDENIITLRTRYGKISSIRKRDLPQGGVS